MAIALFMKIDGVSGESSNAKYKDHIELDSFHWGASQPSSMASGTGGSSGKVSFHDLTAVGKMDKAYPTVMSKMADGKHFASVDIMGAKMGEGQMEYLKITLQDVLITVADVSGANGAELVANYAFQAAKIKWHYVPQDDKGKPGGAVDFGFDIKQNKTM
ncbi:MAG: type VI secretion system tube protein Hcp [Betaproteobacteria bacterium]